MELPIFDRNPHDQCNQSQPTTHNQQQTANNKQQQERRMLITMMIGIIVSTRASLGNLRTIPSPRSQAFRSLVAAKSQNMTQTRYNKQMES